MAWKERPKGRSVPCNNESLKHFREATGLTQEELGILAGLTPRAIAKAEAGGSMHPDSIEKIAEALSKKSLLVHPEDLVSSPKVIARQLLECYAEHERQCCSHFHKFLADDVTILAPGDPELIPFAGEYRTPDGFDQFWGKFFAIMERQDRTVIVDSAKIIAEGNEVVVLTNESAVFKGQKASSKTTPLALFLEFERGKLKRLVDHFDVGAVEQEIRAIIGRSASAAELLKRATANPPS